MSFNGADYDRIITIARRLYSIAGAGRDIHKYKHEQANLCKELFDMCEAVRGQQMPPLGGHRDD